VVLGEFGLRVEEADMAQADMARFIEAQLEVETLVIAQGRMDRAEELINEDPGLDDEQRAALWLYGWSLLPPDRQRCMALSYMQNLEADRWSVT
jgi:hypothetical protein